MEIDSQHTDMVHDAQFDYYSKLLATCSSDKTVRIHSVNSSNSPTTSAATQSNGATAGQSSSVTASASNPGGNPAADSTSSASNQPSLVLKGHSGPVWQVSWSHPAHNSLLASCSYDGKVIIWDKATIIHEHDFHSASVNSCAWAPHEFGPVVGCASSDGKVSVLQYAQDSWTFSSFVAHTVGVNAISFCPSASSSVSATASGGAKDGGGPGDLMCVTGGCDNQVKVWKLISGQWTNVAALEGHSDWVRSVAWSPLSITSSYKVHTIASCSPDKTVCIWTSSDCVTWEKRQVITLGYPLWRVSWSVTGHLLAVAGSSDSTLLYSVDSATGHWTQISSAAY